MERIGTRRRCGAVGVGSGAVEWRVWAPLAERVDLMLVGSGGRSRRMAKEAEGYFAHREDEIAEGQRYVYWLDDGRARPDPCSLWQPEGVDGPSAVVGTEGFHWDDAGWGGVRREDLVFYELHVGTFTWQGTFEAIIPRLGSLRELGVTALELMPVGQFPGTRNWGYDGVFMYAAQESYGGPRGLAALVEACHGAGLGVYLDVVYNHAGPEGNCLGSFGPYFTDRYKTPWGRAMNFDGAGCEGARRFVLDNVRMWLREFHIDGLRLDAVHEIYDAGEKHIVREIKEVAEAISRETGWPRHIVVESDLNDPRVLGTGGGEFGADAQWSDDFHHAVHAYLTGEKRGYYGGYGTAEQVARVMEKPFLHVGERTDSEKGGGEASGDRFVVFIQNHDQVGNRATGERLGALLCNWAKQRLAGSLMLLSAHLPLIFMGEEYGEASPFPFFCSFRDDGLVKAVREGRAREAEAFGYTETVADPQSEAIFESAKLRWSWSDGTKEAGLRRMYRDLLEARRKWPGMRDFAHRRARLAGEAGDEGVIEMLRGGMRVYFNLGGEAVRMEDVGDGEMLLFSSEGSQYGGGREEWDRVGELGAYEAAVIGPGEWKRYTGVSGSAGWF